MRRSMALALSLFAILSVAILGSGAAQNLAGKKILWIDSYHEGYEWSDGIGAGLRSTLAGSGATLDVYHMDTKNNPAEEFKVQAGLKAKAYIDRTKPNLIVASDDNATKYLIMPYFKDSSIPVIHLGINWDASIYGLPYKNTTGMIEVSLVKQLVAHLREYAKGDRLGFITGDSETERKELKYYQELFGIKFAQTAFVTTFEDWKAEFRKMAGSVDAIFFGNNAGIKGWNVDEAAALAASVTKIPSGTINGYIMPYVMIGMVKPPEEFGVWAAQTAIRILGGMAPSTIPSLQNKQTKLQLNVKLASKAGIVFKPALLKNATLVQ